MDRTAAANGVAVQPSTPESAQPHPPGNVPPEDDDYFAGDPDVIFRREWSKLDTVPLAEPVPLRVYVLFVVFMVSCLGGAIIGTVTYPTVTVTITPLARQVTYTGQFDLATRQLAPVTVRKTASRPTTGRGHQDATKATGTLMFYNGGAMPQDVPAGSVFTANAGVQVTIDHSLTVPAANLPAIGSLPVSAHAVLAGSRGNIAAFAIDLALSPDLKVRNEAPFSRGRDARDFPAVAQTDLDSLTSALQAILVAAIHQAFRVQQGESVFPTDCHFKTTTDHGVGDEATTLVVTATDTCIGVAYRQDDLQQRAVAVFTRQTRPDANYTLLRTAAPQVASVTPLTVRLSGTWVYLLSADYQEMLAEHIAGDTPAQAQKYLLATGVITKASVPAQLPKDPGHIHFLTLVGA